jgi:RND family efflux transporter MFP subunit
MAILLAAWWLVVGRGPQVRVTVPARGTAAEVVYATGKVEPVLWAKVAALQRKRIVEICKCEGQQVRKGEVLARLDNVEERAVLTELEARLARIREDAERLRGLSERNVVTRVAYEEKLTQVREYEARVLAQRDRLGELELKAPMDGVVLRRDGEVGEIAGITATDVLLWVGQPKPLRIVAEVNEEDIAKVRKGQTVLVRHEGFDEDTLRATVDELTPKGDPSTKTFRVYFALPDTSPLQIGMSVEANIVVREAKDALLVPAEALTNGSLQVVENGRIVLRKVQTGIKGTRMVEVVEGLPAGTLVLSPARAELRDGASVRPVRSPAK